MSHEELCEGKLGELAKPFPEEAVILRAGKDENALEIPPLDEGQFLGMSLGIDTTSRN